MNWRAKSRVEISSGLNFEANFEAGEPHRNVKEPGDPEQIQDESKNREVVEESVPPKAVKGGNRLSVFEALLYRKDVLAALRRQMAMNLS